uniref:ribosomal protein L22 n=1 Tax=Solanum imamense TaxID=2802707 RepID=UPI001FCCDA3B|nr:ribosomal protein L22 [Solanum imamense]UNZ92755.1 ribosomal protein L22 [Solanum imamense]
MLKKKKTEVYALGEHISMSADKARRVIDQIRGRSYEETLMILELMPYRACYPILKLVYSAAANASYNMGSSETNLVISKAEVNEGTIVKKLIVICIIAGDYGTKNKSTWFQTGYNPRSSFPLVFTTHKLF